VPVSDATNSEYLPISQWYLAFMGWCRMVAAAALLAMLFVAVPDDDLAGIVRLERLAHNIEDAPELSLQARHASRRLVLQQREIVGLNPTYETRRKAAIERLTAAINAKDGAASRTRLVTSNSRNAGD
jgi:hypothetical protein